MSSHAQRAIAFHIDTCGEIRCSDLHYATDSHSSINNGIWYNKEYKTATLYILADFKTTTDRVPEPATLSLMGAGLAGLAARKRRKSKQ